jgi:hypothetical protein
VKLPLLDLTDQARVRAVDVWGDFLDTIEQASQRYTPQAILIGRLYPLTSRTWEVRWTLVHRDNVTRWQQQSGDISSLIVGGVGHTAELLIQSFTRSFDTGSASMLVQVDGITSLKQYRRVLDYLSGVHGVSTVMAEKVTPESMRFRLQTEGGSDAVLQTIALGDVLEKVDEPVVEPAPVVMTPVQPEGGVDNTQGEANQGESDSREPAGSTAQVEIAQPSIPVMRYRLVP